MSLSSTFAITSRNADWGHVLIEARRIIGIPAEHPLTARTDPWGDIEVCSTPGGFSSALIVKYRDGLPVTTGCDEQPVTFVQVAFDSPYGPAAEPCVWFLNDGRPTREWCCGTHMYSGGEAGIEGQDHPDTCPAAEEDEGEDPFVLHRRATLELGAWCDAYGLEWWTCDEPLLGAPYRGWVKGEPVWPTYTEATA